jgi:hypothetical protein
MKNVVDTLIEVTLKNDDDFLKVRETLTRIGIASPKDRKLYQSCHILHKRSKYYIVHFKELFALDGKASNFSEDDVARRNSIVKLLEDWSLIEVVNKDKIKDPIANINQIKIITHKEKNDWELVTKYNIGKKAY